MHWFNGTLAFAFSATYIFFSLPAIYPSVSVLEIPLELFQVSGACYVVVAVAHWLALARLVRYSLQAKHLAFTGGTTASETLPHSQSQLLLLLHRLHTAFWAPWNRVFSIDGLCGVNGQYFYVAFFARELLEIGLQIYQANQLSHSVRRSWIASLAVVIVVFNSFSSTLVTITMRHRSESARRFVSLLVDMCIDFCCAAIIPICVILPLIVSYDPSVGSLPTRLVYDDTWFIAAVAEIRQFCITSIADLLATMVPQVSVLMCLNVARKLVRNSAHVRHQQASSASPQMYKQAFRRAAITIVAMSRVASPAEASQSLVFEEVNPAAPPPQPPPSRFYRSMDLTVRILLAACAVATLTVHISAAHHANSAALLGCRLSLDAWLVRQTPCAIMQINCHRDKLQGLSDEIAVVIDPIDRTILKKLIITHCPQLEIPPLLLEFNALTDLDLYNSTLVSWPREAAATSSNLRSLTNLNWFASPYISFPEGLLHSDLPAKFTRFAIAKSNLTELPDALGELWGDQFLDVFSVQMTNLFRLPSSFNRLRIRKLRLISNSLSHIGDDALATKQLRVLHLSGNPLTHWPASVGDTAKLVELYVEHTQLSNLSQDVAKWWDGRPRSGLRLYSLSLVGSPMCVQADEDDGDPFEVCAIDYDNANGTYRWDLIESQRTVDS